MSKVTQELLDSFTDYTFDGKVCAFCCYCDKQIQKGSMVDDYWPYMDEYSHHLSCRRKHLLNPVKFVYRERLMAERDNIKVRLKRIDAELRETMPHRTAVTVHKGE